jgi:hypothetical protein
MLLQHPMRKIRHLLQRFGDVEQEIARLHGRLDELHGAVLAGRAETGRLQEESTRQGGRLLALGEQVVHEHLPRIQHDLLEIRDSVHLIARRSTLARPTTRALFLVHHIEAWDSYHAVVTAMRDAPDFEPLVASIPRRFNGSPGLEHEEEIDRGLTARGVPHLRITAGQEDEALGLIKAIEPDLVFRQSQWDADIPADLGTDHLTFARLCLVPYETMNIVQNVPDHRGRNTAVDSALHRSAWAVFCANELMLGMASRDGALAGARSRVTGHPKADRLREAVPQWPLASGAPGSAGGRIAWSAHHSIGEGWSDFGIFPQVADDMLAWARQQPDTEFVFMPHPALFPYTSSPDSPYSREQLDAWLENWRALPNTALFPGGDYAPVLAASDALITDGLSMLVEYQVLGKPLIFLERRGHRPFNEIGEIVRTGAHAVTSVAAARSLAVRFLAGESDPLRERQQVNVAQLFGGGRSADRILDAIRGLAAVERGEAPAVDGDVPRPRG